MFNTALVCKDETELQNAKEVLRNAGHISRRSKENVLWLETTATLSLGKQGLIQGNMEGSKDLVRP